MRKMLDNFCDDSIYGTTENKYTLRWAISLIVLLPSEVCTSQRTEKYRKLANQKTTEHF